MIEGLKVTVAGKELRGICTKRAEYHECRAKAYAEQLQSMEAAQIEGMEYSGGNPRKSLADKKAEHEAQAGELNFIGAHLVDGETYLLGRDDLTKLGITNPRGWY